MRMFAWENGQGPWGKPSAPKSSKKSPLGSGSPRQTGGQTPQPDLEDVLNQMSEKLKGFWRTGGPDGTGNGFGNGWDAKAIAAGFLGLWVLSGFYVVAPDEQAVIQRFGAYAGTANPGLNYHLPFPVEKVTKVPVTRENVTTIGFRMDADSNQSDAPGESMMLTGDENIIDLDFTVRWRILTPQNYLFQVAYPAQTVADVAESVMRETIGRHKIDDVLTDNKVAIQQEARTHLQAVLDYYKLGVQINGVELQQVNPPAEVVDAFRDVQAARADAEKLVNEAQGYANQILPLARGQASKIIQEAEGYKAATIAEAQGQANRFRSQAEAYKTAPSPTRSRLYFETMEDVLKDQPKVILTGKGGGNILPFLPLDKLTNKPQPEPETTGKEGR